MQQRSRLSTLAAGLASTCAGLLIAGTASAAEPFVKKTLDGMCMAMDHPAFYETRIYIRKSTMQECIASGGVELPSTPSADDQPRDKQVVATAQ
jgi:hypothetical protein